MTGVRSRDPRLFAAAAVGAALLPWRAEAHVRYRDLDAPPLLETTTYGGRAIDDPCAGRASGCQSSNAFTRYGWRKGTEPSLGNSHSVTLNAEFWRFHLDSTTTVAIAFVQGEAGLDPAFTVYSGLLPALGHDDTPVDPLAPADPSGCAMASPVDAHDAPYAYAPHDGYRDTAAYSTLAGLSGCKPTEPFFGQFDAFGSWSMANPAGDWGRVTYVASVGATPFSGNDGGAHTVGNHLTASGTGESLTLELPAGDYTVAAGGEACATTAGPCSAVRYGTVSFTRVGSGPSLDAGLPRDGGSVAVDAQPRDARGPPSETGGRGADAESENRDASGDAGPPVQARGGCACSAGAAPTNHGPVLSIAAFISFALRRARRRTKA